MRRNSCGALIALVLGLATAGCGSYMARRIAQAPNTYPRWLAPVPRVQLALESSLLTNFTARFAEVGPPSARLRYRLVEPADYHLQFSATNWIKGGHPHARFDFKANLP